MTTRITITLEPANERAREWIGNWISKLLTSVHIDEIDANIHVSNGDIDIEHVIR